MSRIFSRAGIDPKVPATVLKRPFADLKPSPLVVGEADIHFAGADAFR
jgi:hypothetical protein